MITVIHLVGTTFLAVTNVKTILKEERGWCAKRARSAGNLFAQILNIILFVYSVTRNKISGMQYAKSVPRLYGFFKSRRKGGIMGNHFTVARRAGTLNGCSLDFILLLI